MTALSEWLQLMLAEIARKRDDLDRAQDEESQRRRETNYSALRASAPRAQPPAVIEDSLSQDDDVKSRAVLESARSQE
jgi:hypothetical protein